MQRSNSLTFDYLRTSLLGRVVEFEYEDSNRCIRSVFGTLNEALITGVFPSAGTKPEAEKGQFYYFDVVQAKWIQFSPDNFLAVWPKEDEEY